MKIHEKLAEQMANISPVVEEMVVSRMRDREANKQADAIVSVLDTLSRLEKEFHKINKPDQESFDAKGELVSSTFSKSQAKLVKEASEKIEKVKKALEKAFDKGDLSGVYDLAKSPGKPDAAPG